MIKKQYIVILLLPIGILCSCSKNNYLDIKEVPEIELTNTKSIHQNTHVFTNTSTNQKVSVIHTVEETGFHFYNCVKFKTEKIGVLAGGAGLRTRITTNGGISWNEFRFSRFANPFHSIAFSGNSVFIVGESKYIFKSEDFGENWSVLNTAQFFEINQLTSIKYFKIRFLDDQLGFIAGERDNHPILLKTIDGGRNWNAVEHNMEDKDGISDINIISDKEIFIVTLSGNCYKSSDGGRNWELLYKSEDELISFNAIGFKNSTVGFIGGSNGQLLYTNNGGNKWNRVNLPKEINRSDVFITNIEFIENGVLINIKSTFHDQEIKAFVYRITEDGKYIKPFLTKNDHKVEFMGDSFATDELNDTVFILDRNNLYKTLIHREGQ